MNPNCKHIEALINAYLQKAANEEKKSLAGSTPSRKKQRGKS